MRVSSKISATGLLTLNVTSPTTAAVTPPVAGEVAITATGLTRRAAATALSAVLATTCLMAWAQEDSTGLLDQPLVTEGNGETLVPTLDPDTVVEAVQEEQEALEALPPAELEPRAEAGERAAQVALGVEFAQEAGNLGISAAAANAALADAVRWYSQAAMPGFPNAPALDRSGIQFFPIRVQR